MSLACRHPCAHGDSALACGPTPTLAVLFPDCSWHRPLRRHFRSLPVSEISARRCRGSRSRMVDLVSLSSRRQLDGSSDACKVDENSFKVAARRMTVFGQTFLPSLPARHEFENRPECCLSANLFHFFCELALSTSCQGSDRSERLPAESVLSTNMYATETRNYSGLGALGYPSSRKAVEACEL